MQSVQVLESEQVRQLGRNVLQSAQLVGEVRILRLSH